MGFFRRIPKIIFTAMLTATLLPLASAQATIVHVDGGTWDYGTTGLLAIQYGPTITTQV